MFTALLTMAFLMSCCATGWTHSGRTDKNGGHRNRKAGTYHYHGAPKQISPKKILPKKTVLEKAVQIWGDIDGSGGVDVTDLTHLTSYLFGGKSTPDLIDRSDMNCDGSVDVKDLILLVDILS